MRPVIDQKQKPYGRKTLNQAVQESLSLRIDPVQILDNHKQRLNLALPKQEPLHRIQGALAALRRIEVLPLFVLYRDI